MDYTGKCAIVTGAACGIGRAIARGLAKGHCRLSLIDRDGEALNRTAEEARGEGADVRTFVLDVTDREKVLTAVEETAHEAGRIDILINNAGIYNTFVPFVDTPPEKWVEKINVNILGTLYFTQAVIPHMQRLGTGRIINIASVAGVYGIANMVDYSMTKGGIIAFTKALAKELTPCGITVNAVSPGSIDVKEKHQSSEHSFMGRPGTSEECAAPVLFLASDEASYISGQNYQVDGCRKKM